MHREAQQDQKIMEGVTVGRKLILGGERHRGNCRETLRDESIGFQTSVHLRKRLVLYTEIFYLRTPLNQVKKKGLRLKSKRETDKSAQKNLRTPRATTLQIVAWLMKRHS